jgi:hypothetical protein
MNTPNSWVTKERYQGRWVNTYFDNEKAAKKLCEKIIKKVGRAVWVKRSNYEFQ